MLLSFFKNHLLSKFYNICVFFVYAIVFFLAIQTVSHANNINQNPLKFERISIAEGLSQSYVYDIIQDKNGFIWIATQDGLNRYDGKNFVYYRYNSSDQNSIAGNFIRKLFIDNENTLWVGTNEGLSRYNEALDNFDNFFHDEKNHYSLQDNEVWDIYQDQKNTLLVSTREGLQKFNPENNNFSQIRFRGFENRLKEIKTIFQDNIGNYWLGTYDKGIFLTNSSMTYGVSLRDENKWGLIINASALYDVKFIDNQYWLGTNNGLFIVSQDYKVVKHYTAQSIETSTETSTEKHIDSNTDITHKHSNIKKTLLSNVVRTIEVLDEFTVWLGTLNGLNGINIITGEVSAYQSALHKKALSNSWIYKIYRDNNSKLWLGTNGGGINTFNPIQLKVTHGLFNYDDSKTAVYNFAETSDGTIWFTTDDNQLNKIDENGKISHIKTANNIPFSHLAVDKQDNLWLKTEYKGSSDLNALFYYQTKSNQLTRYTTWDKQYILLVNSCLLYTSPSPRD